MNRALALIVLGGTLALPAFAADEAAKEHWTKAADNAIYAQTLVNEVMAAHPELVVVGMHARAPGKKQETMIASNLDRIGKEDDEDDLAVAHERKTILAPNLKDPSKFEVAIPLRDASGKVIGSLSTVFKYRAGDDELAMHSKALAIRDGLAKKIASADALFGASKATAAATAEILKPGALIQLPDSKGKFDFLRIDSERHRLLAAHENDGTADFFDLGEGKLIQRIKVGAAVDTALDPQSGRYFVSVQEQQRVAIVDAGTLKEVQSIKMDGPTDAMLYVAKYKRIYVTHDDGTHLWAIDPATAAVVGAITIPEGPEYLVYDPAADRIYLNIKTADEVVVINPATNTITAHWKTAPATGPHGMALDEQNHRAFVAGANGKLVAIDTATGKVSASVDITEKVDQIAFDPVSHHIYCAGPDRMSVVATDGGKLQLMGHVPTAATAKNVAVDPKTQDVWTTYTDGKSSYARSWRLR